MCGRRPVTIYNFAVLQIAKIYDWNENKFIITQQSVIISGFQRKKWVTLEETV